MFEWQRLACGQAVFVYAVRQRSWRQSDQLFGSGVCWQEYQLVGWQKTSCLAVEFIAKRMSCFWQRTGWQGNQLVGTLAGGLRLAEGVAG